MKYLWLALVIGWGGSAYAATGTSPPIDTPITIPSSNGTACANPAVPHPAQVAGFTTLAYCADFTQQASINNVVYGAEVTGGAQTTNWTSMNWLDCNSTGSGLVAGKQWIKREVATGSNGGPCGASTVALDSVSGVNALQMTAIPSYGTVALGMATGVDPCSNSSNECYEVFPVTNVYAEINWRVDLSQWSNIVDKGNAEMDFWSWSANTSGNSGCIEIDYIEYFNTFTVGPGIGGINGCSPKGTVGGPAASFTIDSVYHVIGTLFSSNRTNFLTACMYRDGVEVMPGNVCETLSNAGTNAYTQQGYLTLSNYAGHVYAVTGPVTLYVAWIRIWTCAGWNTTGNPQTTSNTCSVASPPTTPP